MDSASYLMSYGWTHGQPLKKGGLRKPILVKHKKDTKGLGHTAGDQEAWWERMFDGQLKSLDVNTSSSSKDGGVTFNQKEVKISAVSQNVSPLYRMFVRGGVLEGSIPPEGISSLRKGGEEDSKKKKKKVGGISNSKRKRDESEVDEKEIQNIIEEKKKSKKEDRKSKKSRSGTSTPEERPREKNKKESKKTKKSKLSSTSSLQKEEEWVRQLIETHAKAEIVSA